MCSSDLSLNPHERPSAELTHRRLHLAHPQFTPATIRARKELLGDDYQGQDGLWFCGAWGGYGFHEGTYEYPYSSGGKD